MKNKIALIVAMGCIGASATTMNYDLLGRRGSKMNSPMVYKDIDYAKMKKKEQQNVGSSLENRSLKKMGLSNSVAALEGAYNSKGFDCYNSSNQCPYYLKRYFSQGNSSSEWFNNINGYVNNSNSAFIYTSLENRYWVSYESAPLTTHLDQNRYSLSTEDYSFTNNEQSSPYERYGHIFYEPFILVNYFRSYRYLVSEYVNSSCGSGTCGDIGMHMVTEALPVALDPSKGAHYIRHTDNEQFSPDINKEMRASKMYNALKNPTDRFWLYVGKNMPSNPASTVKGPQIYIGVHADEEAFDNSEEAKIYSTASKNLDNYIYDKRTVEIVAAGNNHVVFNNGHLAAKAHAANAITVGARDSYSGDITNYNSDQSYYCRAATKPCNGLSWAYQGSRKPEIYNYSHFYYQNGNKRIYTENSTGAEYVYLPYYDGTEIAAAYTANMVVDLMATNAFYRWHPEVVRALMLTSSHVDQGAPTYRSMLTRLGTENGVEHESRYWIGDIDKLKTRDNGSAKEICFSVKKSDFHKDNFVAAISWLSRGDDIINTGYIPQNFELISYASDSPGCPTPLYNPTYSVGDNNNFEKVTFSASPALGDYQIILIRLKEDRSSAEYRGQIALGFDLAAY